MFDRNKKFYTFNIVLYKDSTSYDYHRIIDYITMHWDSYAYIEHKAEKDETKVHTHVLVHFNNRRYLSGVAKELSINECYIEPCNLIPFLRYLIHLDDEDKIQYSPYEVVGPLQTKLIELVTQTKTSEVEQVSMIFDFIAESNKYLTQTLLLQFVLQNGCYSAYRRNFSLFYNLVLEHNKYL